MRTCQSLEATIGDCRDKPNVESADRYVKATIALPGGYIALWLALGLSGVAGGGRLLSIIMIPVGGVMAVGALYVALNIGRVAEELGADTRHRMERGHVWDRLALTLQPDQEQAFRSGATFHILFGVAMCALGIYVNTVGH